MTVKSRIYIVDWQLWWPNWWKLWPTWGSSPTTYAAGITYEEGLFTIGPLQVRYRKFPPFMGSI